MGGWDGARLYSGWISWGGAAASCVGLRGVGVGEMGGVGVDGMGGVGVGVLGEVRVGEVRGVGYGGVE